MNNNPLIIESPERQGRGRRLVQGTITLGLWLLWLYLVLPVVKPVLEMAGIDLSVLGVAAKAVDRQVFVGVLSLIATVVLSFWLWARYNALLHRFYAKGRTPCVRVGREELADSFGICPRALAHWHSAGQLLIRLTEQGGICSVEAGEVTVYRLAEKDPVNESLLQGDMLAVSKAS